MNKNFVIISLLGWQQWKMSGDYCLPVKTMHNYTLLDSFKLKAPKEVGVYEFVAIMLPVRNTFALSKQDSQEENTYPSYRFTIEVIAE